MTDSDDLAVSSHPLYVVFADWAKKHGLGAAVDRFGTSIPVVDRFAAQWQSDLKKVEQGGPPVITAGNNEWYSGPTEASRFWTPLRAHFETEGWPDERVNGVDRASTVVVAHTPMPSRPRYSGKGLVVGYVQSGKTTNFTSVIAKMADEDYDMVVVLSGIHNGLRKQTQERLDEQLRDLNKDHWLPVTDQHQDFHIPTVLPSAYLTTEGKVVLAVVKKNPVVLRRLIRWLESDNAERALQSARVLVIDDEADQASVATARINPLIRKLLDLMPRSVYIGYTATPFANVFIDPTAGDLYPKDFILNLPRPEGYFGPETLFGRDDAEGVDVDGLDMVRRIPDEDIGKLRPLKQAEVEAFVPTLTPEMTDAINWFWLATAARRARGVGGHSTMLIHTSVKTQVHQAFLDPLEQARDDTLRLLRAGDKDLLERLRSQWEFETRRVSAEQWGRASEPFEDVVGHMEDIVAATEVLMDNFRSEKRLDYTGDPVVAIAVGGNTLSRGLTLEGLVVSLFVRGATAYDTLLQMGRWFGYRTGYEDLPRIWTTQELELGFRHLAQVEHEMRNDIDLYQLQNATPAEVAVRIRTHPSLRITAKMGAAEPAEVSYAGRRVQTRYFAQRDRDWLGDNHDAAARLLATANRSAKQQPGDGDLLFRDVPVSAVLAFLNEYHVHEDSPDMDPAMMRKYIDQQLKVDPPRLTEWNVAVVEGTGSPIQVGPIEVKGSTRSKLQGGKAERADIKTLMSKPDIVLDVDISSTDARKLSEQRLKQLRVDDAHVAGKGLLVLYAIDQVSRPETERALKSREDLNAVAPVIGLGIMFPGTPDGASKIKASHVSVPPSKLGEVEVEDLEDALETDHEDDPETTHGDEGQKS
ncbi:Z1 domain-containing protein [Angustibacter sp. McL0619]|uniref:Z1 domain-containing protein n=1 Tax=Angustibacter sp. McL0619 TaxID=3415676 RepID=UPI003CFA6459